MQYWKTHRKDIILQNLNYIMKRRLNVSIWQQHGSHRITFEAKFLNVSRKSCSLKILEGKYDLFNSDIPFYAHIKEVEVLFKKDHFNFYGNSLEFSLPSDIQIFEKRKTKRFSYLYQDHKNITFQSEAVDPKTDQPEFLISSVLVDISTQGAGMVVSLEVSKKLKVGQTLLLNNLTDQELPTPFKMKIVYISPYEINENQLFKVGLIFDDQLNSISYKSISSIIEIKQKKVEGLNPERYCGVGEEEQIRLLNKIETSNKVLANNIKDNIEYLDQLRYMTTQMKVEFLKDVSQDLLAVALRLSSKELVYELFSEVTDNMQEEFLDKLQTERPASAICKAQDEIVKFCRDKERSGEIVLDPKAFITYV